MATLKEFEKSARMAGAIHDAIAADMLKGAKAATVICKSCGRNFPADHAALAGYLRTGWPLCCGHTAMLMLATR